MVCPKCKTVATVKRQNGSSVFVCRNPNCTLYKKPIKAVPKR